MPSDRFWEHKSLAQMSDTEWEALCDGCGKCCLNKLEDEETGEVALTRVACRLFDDATCQCAMYETRRDYVPECIKLTPKTIELHAYWLPDTCAYKLLWQGKSLRSWHPLISGSVQSVHYAGVSVRYHTVLETQIKDDEWEDYIFEEPQ